MFRRHGQSGQIVPLVAISLTALMGFSGMAVDRGYWSYQQRQQQSATDAAAVGGAQALAEAGCPSSASAQSAAYNDATNNGYTNGSSMIGRTTNVVVSNPPASGAYSGNDCAVSVTISAAHQSFFSRVLGVSNMEMSTTATAELISNNPTTMTFLGTGTTTLGGSGGTISATGGGISTNGTFTCGSGTTITAGSIGYAGTTAPSCSKTTFTAATPAPSAPVQNPCPEISGCNYLANNPPSTSNCQTLQANMNPTIEPGCYNELSVGTCGTVTLEPGVYVLNGTSNFSGSSFVGSGVTFYVTSSGTPPDFSNSTSATISPPTSGNEANVLYYQVPANTAAPNFAGSSVHWKGLVYAPTANNVPFNGAQGDYTVLILGSGNLSSTSYTFQTPPTGATLLKNVVLAQ
jgi:hypothetical protein